MDWGHGEIAGDRARILTQVERIPPGRVATYGQVARLAGLERGARQVGWALHGLPSESRLPWQRVVGVGGRISLRAQHGAEELQRLLLEAEGVEFGADGKIDLECYGWRPRARARSRARGRASASREAR